MSRSFFAPDSKTPAAPSDSVRAPFLSNGNGTSTPIENEIRSMKEGGRPGSPIPPPKAALSTLAPILSYCGSSIMMTVLNKYVLKTHFSLNLIVLLIQSLVGGFLVAGASYLKLIEIKPLDIKLLQSWVPVSTSLVFVIWTGSKALQFLSIPVYTIFKNLTIILIAYGEVIWFGGKVTRLTLASFGLMVFSSIIAAYGDISRHMAMSVLSMPHSSDSLAGGSVDPVTHAMKPAYDVLGAEKAKIAAAYDAGQGDAVLDGMGSIINSGYVWMFLNCLCSAAFVLGMRGRMKSANIKEWETCLLNNILSIPVLLVMSFLVEDWSQANFARNFPADHRYTLLSLIVFSGACAVFISYTTSWCIRATSSTTYSMVGALNKLPLALSGILFFGDELNITSGSSIFMGFVAGLAYAYAKNQQAQDMKRAQATVSTGQESRPRNERSESIIPMHQMNGKEERID